MASNITVDFNANLARFTSAVDKATNDLNKFQSNTSRISGNINGVLSKIGIGLSVAGFGAWIKSSIELQDELARMGNKFGIAATEMGGLKFAADQNGTSLEVLAKGIKELSIGMSTTPEKFAKLGINAKDATGALVQMADLISSMPDGMNKTRLMAELMGKKVGPELTELLNQGGTALQGYISKGKDVYKITEESAAKAKEYKDQMAELGARMDGVGISISGKLLPSLLGVSSAMNDLVKDGGDFLPIGKGIETIFQTIFVVGANVGYVFKQIGNEIGGLTAQLVSLAKFDFKGFNAIGVSMKADAEKARADIDAFSEKILNGNNKTVEIAVDVKPKTTPKAVIDLLGNNGQGTQILIALEKDYQNELSKRVLALNAPLLSASEKDLAESLMEVHKRAQDSRIELEKQKTTIEAGGKSFGDYKTRMDEVTAAEEKQVKAITDVRQAQDALNSSFEYGGKVAMRKYMDEAENTAKQSEALFTNAFKGMGDGLVTFVRTGKLDFSSLADSIISDLIRIQIQNAITGIMQYFSGTQKAVPIVNASKMPNAKGNVFGFANGGSFTNKMFNSPTPFRFATGGGFNMGVMGEAGPEAVMPLTRGSDGKLGVRSQGGGININYAPTINIDSRTDRADVERLVSNSVRQGNAELVDKLQRQKVL